jgi:capsular polysaccharide biosynthesis protein
VGFRDIIRGWPLVIVVMMIAVGAAYWSTGRQAPSYTATTRVMVVPLAQWDETFLGTSLLRDSADATRTADTVAAELNSIRAATVAADYLGGGWTPDKVAGAVKVSVFEQTNVLEIVARSGDADTAAKLAEGFALAIQADRWKTISAELDARIASISEDLASATGTGRDGANVTNPTADAASTRLQTLKMVRASGADPTMKIDSTILATQDEQLPIWVVLGLATAGGLFVGLLAAAGVALMRRSVNRPTDEPAFHTRNPNNPLIEADRTDAGARQNDLDPT